MISVSTWDLQSASELTHKSPPKPSYTSTPPQLCWIQLHHLSMVRNTDCRGWAWVILQTTMLKTRVTMCVQGSPAVAMSFCRSAKQTLIADELIQKQVLRMRKAWVTITLHNIVISNYDTSLAWKPYLCYDRYQSFGSFFFWNAIRNAFILTPFNQHILMLTILNALQHFRFREWIIVK